MDYFNNYVLNSVAYRKTFDHLLSVLALESSPLDFLIDAETVRNQFEQVLIREERGLSVCSPNQATYLGEQILNLLDHLFYLLEKNGEIHHEIITLAVSTGVWIALRKGEIKELELLVSAIATFANQTNDKKELEELYEISLLVIYATDSFLKADLDKHNEQRPWRLLCLNHAIIATRTDNADLARLAYDRLIEHLPDEAGAFFETGMRKVSSGNYSQYCVNIMRAYYQMFSREQPHHQVPATMLN
jgi:hypothetical protein